jgi:hypothetical protein
MKKTITLLALCAQVMMTSAADYTDQLTVNVSGTEATPQQTTISLNKQEDGNYSFLLKDFSLDLAGASMDVGTIELNGVHGITSDDVTTLYTQQTIAIKPGSDASKTWLASTGMLDAVPVRIMGEQRGDQLYAVINIDMGQALQIKVTFGKGYQMPNGGFENFHTATIWDSSHKNSATSQEPNHWHSFMSASGNPNLAWLAGYNPHTFVSDVVRPGTDGQHSVLITSVNMFLTIANGTMTTGRVNTGSMFATNVANHAALDMSSADKDGNGDPFYVALNDRPDSIDVWVKFKQSEPQVKYPYATLSAAVTDGTYYQEPADKEYTNVLARAQNKQIASNGFAWQHLTIPFETVNKDVKGKALFITLSTNAQPGAGSTDSLYVDDLSLVYNQDITVNSVSLQGKTLSLADEMSIEADGTQVSADDIIVDTKAAKVIKQIEEADGGLKAYVTVASTDLNTFKTYTINIKGATTGIDHVQQAANIPDGTIYNLQGQRVSSMQQGHVYIVKQGDKMVKVQK